MEAEQDKYEKDFFTDALREGEERMQAVSAVQFALTVRQQDVDSFCEKYVEVFEAISSLPGNADAALRATYELHRRFADEVYEVVGIETSKNWERLYGRELPDTCLLMLTSPAAPRRPVSGEMPT